MKCTVLVAAVFACSAPALAAPPTAAGPSVLFLDGKEGGPCAAKARDVVVGTERVIFTAPACPQAVLWSAARQKVVYVARGHVFIRPLDNAAAAATDLGALPPGDLASLIITDKGRNIRAAMLVRVDDKDVVTKKDATFFRFEGKELSTAGVPPWGTPFVAVLSELDAKGAWKRIDAKATRSEAGDAPGVSVLDRSGAAADVVSLASLGERGTCVGGVLACDVADAAPAKLVGKAEDSMVGKLVVDGKTVAAFRVMFGDTPHAVPPVFACTDDCKTGKKLAITLDQVAILARGGFLLVTDEYSGASPAVFDAAGKEVWRSPTAQGAVWLP